MKIVGKMINILGFQLSWWFCVLGVKYGYPYLGPFVMTLFILVHYLFYKINNLEFIFIFVCGLIGMLVDTFFINIDLIDYNGLTINNIAPLWIISMWLGFAATINHSLSWLRKRYFFAFWLGFIFGPISYLTGVKFNALSFNVSIYSITVLSVAWGIVVPLLFFINERILISDE